MSRVSRVNVDVTATTTGLEAGMRRAEQRVEGFGKRVDGMRSSFEKLRGVVGFGIAGFGVAWAVENTIGQVWKFARGVEAASERASKALEELRASSFDLLITDRGMPGLTGDEVAFAAYVTGESDYTIVVDCAGAAGLDGFIRWLKAEAGVARTESKFVLRPIVG